MRYNIQSNDECVLGKEGREVGVGEERRWGAYSGIDLRVCPPSVTVMNVNVTLHSVQKLGLDTPVV